MKKPVSAVIITKNESASLERCLSSILWCDEIIIVDSQSTDNTREIAERFSPKVKFYDQSFLGYGKQKQLAVSKASFDWILSIDADEVISEELGKEIQSHLSQDPSPMIAHKIPRTLVFMGTKLQFCGEAKRPVLRFFHRKNFNFNDARVHEEVVGQGTVQCFEHEMLHFSYKNWTDYVTKLNHYTDQMAIKLKEKGFKKSASPTLRFLGTFFKIYFLKLGILDGKAGFTWAISSGFANMLKYLKFDDLLTSPSTKD